jgi:general stress protein 26
VAHDPDRARALWNENQKLWWSGPDDPNLRVVRVEPEKAEMWDNRRVQPLPLSNSPRRV